MNFITSLLSLAAWSLWGYILVLVDPEVPGAPAAFYATLFVALACTLARLLATSLPEESGEPAPPPVPALGHGAIVSTVLLFGLWLQSLRALTTLNVILLGAMLGFIELGFSLSGSAGRRSRPRRRALRPPAADGHAFDTPGT